MIDRAYRKSGVCMVLFSPRISRVTDPGDFLFFLVQWVDRLSMQDLPHMISSQSSELPFLWFLFRPVSVLVTLVLIVVITTLGPTEQTLGSNLRMVLLHGAWVWTGIVAFTLAGLSGWIGMLSALKKPPSALARPMHASWPDWSIALGRTGLFFWLAYLPMSLYVMQVNWGGFAFSEARWRIPFTFGVVAVLLQVGLALFDQPLISSAGNLLFGAALLWSLATAESVLHPNSPISQSGSLRIQLYFAVLLALCLLLGAQIALWLRNRIVAQKLTSALIEKDTRKE